jgi:hypothetical protein
VVEGGPERGGTNAAVAFLLASECRQQSKQADAPLSHGHRPWCGIAERDRAEPVAAACRDVTERNCDSLGDVGLAPVGGPEKHRGRRVEDDPGHEYPLGLPHADVRLASAGRDVPVDRADVVARNVRPDLRELRSLALENRPVIPGEQPFHPAADRHVERAQQPFRDRSRAGTVRPDLGAEGSGEGHAAVVRARSILGTGTAASTLSRIVSGLTSSANAW